MTQTHTTRIENSLRAHRRARGLTQEELANAVSVSRGQVIRWEQHAEIPDIYKIRLARYFDIPVHHLIHFDTLVGGA